MTPQPVVEHAILMSGGSMQVRPDDPGMERIDPLARWTERHQRHGGKVYTRTVIVVEDWHEVSALGADTQERIGEVAITSITLLAPGAVPDDTGRLPGCICGLTGPATAPDVAVIDPKCPHHSA